jgi:hypothetical protein
LSFTYSFLRSFLTLLGGQLHENDR